MMEVDGRFSWPQGKLTDTDGKSPSHTERRRKFTEGHLADGKLTEVIGRSPATWKDDSIRWKISPWPGKFYKLTESLPATQKGDGC